MKSYKSDWFSIDMPLTVDELSDFLAKWCSKSLESTVKDERAWLENSAKSANEGKMSDDEYQEILEYVGNQEFMDEDRMGHDFLFLHEYYTNPDENRADNVRQYVSNKFSFLIWYLKTNKARNDIRKIIDPVELGKWSFPEYDVETIYKVTETPTKIWFQALEKTREQIIPHLKKAGHNIDDYLMNEDMRAGKVALHEIPKRMNLKVKQEYSARPE